MFKIGELYQTIIPRENYAKNYLPLSSRLMGTFPMKHFLSSMTRNIKKKMKKI